LKENAEKEKLEADLKKLEEERQKELERKRQEELQQWKSSIVIEKEGTEQRDLEDLDSKMNEFIDFIVSRKMVLLEELAQQFGVKTKEVLDRLRKLESEGRISGVVDDRGKYIRKCCCCDVCLQPELIEWIRYYARGIRCSCSVYQEERSGQH